MISATRLGRVGNCRRALMTVFVGFWAFSSGRRQRRLPIRPNWAIVRAANNRCRFVGNSAVLGARACAGSGWRSRAQGPVGIFFFDPYTIPLAQLRYGYSCRLPIIERLVRDRKNASQKAK